MLVDGKHIASEVYTQLHNRITRLSRAPKLCIITCAPTFETQKYLALKQARAEEVGIETEVTTMSPTSTTEDFIVCINSAIGRFDGIIVQLPLPSLIDRNVVVTAVPPSHDVDALNPDTTQLLSPVVGAIREILAVYDVMVREKKVTVIGNGRLVGLPSYTWFREQGAEVSLVTKDTVDVEAYTQGADIIVCGAGVPGLLTPEMVKEGVVILDAGTTEDGGELKGDAHPSCGEKASLYTPVPGGIGPLTIAMLLRNVVDCAERHVTVV